MNTDARGNPVWIVWPQKQYQNRFCGVNRRNADNELDYGEDSDSRTGLVASSAVCRWVKVKVRKLNSQYKPPWRHREVVELWLYSFFNLGATWGWVVRTTSRPFNLGEWLGAHCIGGWVGSRSRLDGCCKIAPIEIRSPDHPACGDSLYRLSYPGSRLTVRPK